MRVLALVVILIAASGCSVVTSPALEPINLGEAWAIAEPLAEPSWRLVYVDAGEHPDPVALEAQRLEENRDFTNVTLRTADPQVGDGRAYTWRFDFLDDETRLMHHLLIGPEGLLYSFEEQLSAKWIEARYEDTVIPMPLPDPGALMAELADPLFEEWVASGAVGAMAVVDVLGAPHILYFLERGEANHMWVFDAEGVFLGLDEFIPAGLGYAAAAWFAEVTPLRPETVTLPLPGPQDELVVTLHAYSPFTPAAGYAYTLTVTAPDGTQHTTSLEILLDDEAYSILRIPEAAAGEWQYTVAMDRGTAGAMPRITVCAAGWSADDAYEACQHL